MTMVYDTYYELVTGIYKPTNITFGAPTLYSLGNHYFRPLGPDDLMKNPTSTEPLDRPSDELTIASHLMENLPSGKRLHSELERSTIFNR